MLLVGQSSTSLVGMRCSISPASLQPGSVSEKRRADIQQHVVTAVEPLVQSLLLNHDFMLEVTKSETSSEWWKSRRVQHFCVFLQTATLRRKLFALYFVFLAVSGEKNGLPSLMLNLQILGLLPQLAGQ